MHRNVCANVNTDMYIDIDTDINTKTITCIKYMHIYSCEYSYACYNKY